MGVAATTLCLDGMTIPVETGGTSRKAKLTIDRDGSLQLKAAPDIEQGELEHFLASKREWIYRKLAEKESLRYAHVIKEIVDGEGFLYLGRSHQLRIVDTDDNRVLLRRGKLNLPMALAGSGPAHIIAWYRTAGLTWLRPRAREWAKRLGVDCQPIEVVDLGNKWGSALPDGRVRIHWATMQLRPALVEYVLAHELAHLREAHHGPAFWQLLSRALPDCDQRKAELANTGATLWHGDGA